MARGRHSTSISDGVRTRILEDLERIQHLVLRISQALFPESKAARRPSSVSASPVLPMRFQSFAARMKFLRSARGLTLDQVARAVGSHKGYVSSIETGQMRPPSPRYISRLARLYSVDERELLRLAYAEKAPDLIRDEIIRALWP
jgi:hypothetical protein